MDKIKVFVQLQLQLHLNFRETGLFGLTLSLPVFIDVLISEKHLFKVRQQVNRWKFGEMIGRVSMLGKIK